MTSPADEGIAPPARGDSRLSDPERDDTGEADDAEIRSLLEDVQALIEDGRTYLEAEMAFQKTRAAFVADRAKAAAIFGAVAAAFGFVALTGLAVGLIFALTPWLTAWGASAVVVLMLAGGGLLAARTASRSWSQLVAAIDDDREGLP